jgi:hypothetical protein
MKLVLNFSFLLFSLLVFDATSFSLTDYQIRIFCEQKRNKLTCIKKLKERRLKLQKGNMIEIPVIPHKR